MTWGLFLLSSGGSPESVQKKKEEESGRLHNCGQHNRGNYTTPTNLSKHSGDCTGNYTIPTIFREKKKVCAFDPIRGGGQIRCVFSCVCSDDITLRPCNDLTGEEEIRTECACWVDLHAHFAVFRSTTGKIEGDGRMDGWMDVELCTLHGDKQGSTIFPRKTLCRRRSLRFNFSLKILSTQNGVCDFARINLPRLFFLRTLLCEWKV